MRMAILLLAGCIVALAWPAVAAGHGASFTRSGECVVASSLCHRSLYGTLTPSWCDAQNVCAMALTVVSKYNDTAGAVIFTDIAMTTEDDGYSYGYGDGYICRAVALRGPTECGMNHRTFYVYLAEGYCTQVHLQARYGHGMYPQVGPVPGIVFLGVGIYTLDASVTLCNAGGGVLTASGGGAY